MAYLNNNVLRSV